MRQAVKFLDVPACAKEGKNPRYAAPVGAMTREAVLDGRTLSLHWPFCSDDADCYLFKIRILKDKVMYTESQGKALERPPPI